MLRISTAVFAAGVFFIHSPIGAQSPATSVTSTSSSHVHAEHGPHGGEILEVGKDEYHMELIIDEAKKQVVVYLLDGKMKDFVAIDAAFLAANLKIAGKPVQIKILPIPQEIDQKGFSSRYGLVSPPLVDALHREHSDARLALRIGKKAYTVKLEHHHDHAAHKHGPTLVK